MNMHSVDWVIVFVLLGVLTGGALSTRRYTKSVSAFMAANRCGGRYIISVASGMAQVGVISMVWFFEMNYEVGFTAIWWGLMEGPAMIIMALSAWVIYRYRQTRAMTLAQFFEMRYSRKFRVFSGLVAYLAGIINFGIFPSVGARFFMSLCALPENFMWAGLEISTFVFIMILLLSVSLLFTFLGGQIAVMVTDFLQGTFCNFAFIIIILYLLSIFSWDQISEVLLQAPAEKSQVHPFHLGKESYFNFWYYAIAVVIMFYSVQGWQGTQGYYCCAKNAHENKMAGILGQWRFRVLMLITLVIPICARTLIHHPDFSDKAALVQASLDKTALEVIDKVPTTPQETQEIEQQRKALKTQLRAPTAIGIILPTGLLGLMCAAMLAAFVSTHDSYLHSWGTIFIQDVVLPFRKKPLTTRQHLWLLRLSIFGVAVFIFMFSLLFRHVQFIAMFCAITASIFIGGAGVAIIGGLYWKRGTTPAAWSVMITGMVLSLVGILITQGYLGSFKATDTTPQWFFAIKDLLSNIGLADAFHAVVITIFSLTGQEMTFWIIVISVTVYILVSLLGPRKIFNMDRLLHRGKYAVAGETSVSFKDARTVWEKLGFTREFTGRDKIIAYITLSWPLIWTLIFVAFTVYNIFVDVPQESWLSFWHGWTWFILFCAVVITTWFTIGGIGDIRYLYRRLRTSLEDESDDGRVVDEQNQNE